MRFDMVLLRRPARATIGDESEDVQQVVMTLDPVDLWVRVAKLLQCFLLVLAALFREWFQAPTRSTRHRKNANT